MSKESELTKLEIIMTIISTIIIINFMIATGVGIIALYTWIFTDSATWYLVYSNENPGLRWLNWIFVSFIALLLLIKTANIFYEED